MMEIETFSNHPENFGGLHEEKVEDWRNLEFSLVDQNLVFHFRNLIKKYNKQMGDTNDTFIVSGGLQQYLNKQKTNTQAAEDKVGIQRDDSAFSHLPVNVKLHIFSFLEAKDLCKISEVCKDWYINAQDNLLWHGLLMRNVKSWNIIGHMTNPILYQEVESEWSNKDIYLRCCPEINQLMHKQHSVFTSISSMLRYFLPKKVPKVAMFGPGLESSTSGIVRKMLYEESMLERVGLVPGQFEGVGSGWCLRMENSQMFQLSVLYSASKKDREARQRDRKHDNRLLNVKKGDQGSEEFELKSAVRDYCRTVDAFIYVVESSLERDSVDEGNEELFAMVNERWSATHVPVLVLSCVHDASQSRIPCITVVEKLEVAKLNRPWQVRNCVVQNLEGVIPGIEWLVEQSQRR